MRSIRFRTLGCYPLTGAVGSEAATLSEVIQEMLLTTTSERQGRAIDRDSRLCGGLGVRPDPRVSIRGQATALPSGSAKGGS